MPSTNTEDDEEKMCRRHVKNTANEVNEESQHQEEPKTISQSSHEEPHDADHAERAERKPPPLETASILSKATFSWPYPLLKLGMERPLTEADLPSISEKDSSAYNRKYFERIWEEEKRLHPANPMLQRALLKDFFTSIWYVQPMYMLGAVAKISQAVALGLLIESFEQNNGDGYLWASVIVLGALALLAEHHHAFMITWRKGMQMRIAAIAAIYYKSQRLSSTHQETSANYGQIMNLASNDVERFLMACLFGSHLIWAPIQSIAILCVGWSLMGPAFAAGFVLLFGGFIPLQVFLSRRFIHYRGKIAGITDNRVNFVSQAVYGARVMKMSGFEERFLERIHDYRKQEVSQITRANRLKAWNEALFFSANVVISVVIFMVYVATGNTLTPRDVFTTFTLVNIIQIEMTKHVSLGVLVSADGLKEYFMLIVDYRLEILIRHFSVCLQGVSEAFVSVNRIQHFLEFPELPDAASREAGVVSHAPEHTDEVAISLHNVTCMWNEVTDVGHAEILESVSVPAIKDVSLDLKWGQLTCLVGPVGSGKSALLQALVGELPVKSGTLERRFTTLAYAAQDPWIMGGTVKENITMGLEFNAEWYDKVVDCCGLNVDFLQLRDGDKTVVGDKGVQVSGGQRARIGLARALYKDADVLIADDPLSAVDAKVGRQLFQEAIMGLAVNRGKCAVVATHQHQHISEQRCALVMDGTVSCVGTYAECVTRSNGKLVAHAKDDSIDNLDARGSGTGGKKSQRANAVTQPGAVVGGELEKVAEGEEITRSGVVEMDTYLKYVRAMGGLWVGVMFAVLFSVTQAAVLITIATIGRWAERPTEDQQSWDILGLVLGLSALVVALAIFRAMLSLKLTVKASQRLHDRMAEAVIRAKIEFFDTNPLGRILNRFSADVGICDDQLPQTLFDFWVIAFIVLGAIATTITVLPFTLLAFPPLVWYFLRVRRIFVTSTRELKRLEGLARSPIFAMLRYVDH